jgi:hypothetical protein
MLNFLFRTIGVWLLAAAVVAGVVDGMRSIASMRLVLTSTGQVWAAVAPASLANSQAFVHRLSPALWDQVAAPALMLPIWAVFVAFGILFALLGARRRRQFIYAS